MSISISRFLMGLALGLCACLANAQAPGAFDTSFDGDGRLDIKLLTGGTDEAKVIANYPDRRYVIIARCVDNSGNLPCVLRINEDGSLDSAFGSGGKITTQLIAGHRMSLAGLAVQPDGKVLVSGSCQPTAGGSVPCHVRLLANGQIDTGYGSGGSVIPTITGVGSGLAAGIAVQADGKIVVGGHCFDSGFYFCAWRYSPSGVPDTTYGTGGAARVNVSPNYFGVIGLVLAPDNAAILYGYCDYGTSTSNLCVVRFNASGARDTGYVGGAGVPTLPHHAAAASAYEGPSSALLQPDGHLVIGGYCVAGSATQACVTRVTPAGALDTSFGGGWVVPSSAALGAQSFVTGVNLQRDGKLVMSAACVDRNKVCALRLNSDGSLDDGYGTAGIMAVTTSGYATELGGSVLDADERLLLGGGCYGNDGGGITDTCYWRLQRGQSYAGRSCSLDVDNDGVALSANDVLIMTRAAMGFSGSTVLAGVTLSPAARRTTWADMRDYLFNQCGMTRLR